MKRRILAWILTVFMLATMLPAYAEESPELKASLSLGTTSGFVGDAVQLNLSVSGVTDGVKVTYYSAYNGGSQAALNNTPHAVVGGKDALVFTPNKAGTYTLTAIATAGTLKATAVATLRVAEHDTTSLTEWGSKADAAVAGKDWQADLAAVAKSQLGYTESETDFIRNDDGSQLNYSIYGDEAGDAYQDWNLAFVNYALGKVNVPVDLQSSTIAELIAKAKEANMLMDGENYVPQVGDIVLFDGNRLGIVIESENGNIMVIVGDADGEVDIVPLDAADVEEVVTDKEDFIDNSWFLKEWLEFGVTANGFNQRGDLESNFAAGKYTNNNQTTGDNTTSNPDTSKEGSSADDAESNNPGDIWIGEFVDINNVEFKLHDPRAHVRIDPSLKQVIKDGIDAVYNRCVEKVNLDTQGVVFTDNTFDVTGCPDNSTIYIDFESYISSMPDTGITLKKHEGQTVVFNFKTQNADITLYDVFVDIDGTVYRANDQGTIKDADCRDVLDLIARRVIWNMPYAKSVNFSSNGFCGTALAPKADVTLPTTAEGWLVANTLDSSGEWHHNARNISNPKYGNLVVTKTVEGENVDNNDYAKDFEFTVVLRNTVIKKSIIDSWKCEGQITFAYKAQEGSEYVTDVVLTVKMRHGYTLRLTDLPDGIEYEVYEKDDSGQYVKIGDGVTGRIVGDENGQYTSQVDVVNYKKDEEFGQLLVTKTLEGAGADYTDEFEFEVTLGGDYADFTGTLGNMDFVNGVAKFKMKAGEVKYASDLPDGTPYTVEETDSNGYTIKSASVVNGTIKADAVEKAEFVNSKDKKDETTEVTVNKSWVGDEEALDARPSSIKVQLYHGEEKYGEEVTLSAPEWTYTWKDLPKDGVEYSVKEPIVVEGYTATVTKEADGSYKITNTYDKKDETTEVTVNKSWVGDEEALDARPESIKVQLYHGEEKYGEEVTLSAPEWTYTWKDLPKDGVEYSVKEPIVVEGYTATVKKEADGSYRITNTYEGEEDEFGSLTVEKKVFGFNDNTKNREYAITINLVLPVDAETSGYEYKVVEGDKVIETQPIAFAGSLAKITVLIADGQKIVIDNLPMGTTYVISETSGDYKTTWNGEARETFEGTITATEANAYITCVNTITAALQVQKTVTGSAGEKDREFKFTVTLIGEGAENVNGWYPASEDARAHAMYFEKGVATFTLKHGEYKLATGLPMWLEYTVEEEDLSEEGYTTDAVGDNDVFDERCVKKALFVNRKDKPENTPENTTPAPGETTPAPGETTPAPGETTPAPGETTPAPG